VAVRRAAEGTASARRQRRETDRRHSAMETEEQKEALYISLTTVS